MTAPGVQILERTTQTSRAPDIDTGQAFMALAAPQGPTIPTLVRGMPDVTALFGQRNPTYPVYDAADGFFRSGGRRLWIVRPVSSTAVKSTIALKDASNADTLRLTLRGAGAWGNTITAAVVPGVGSGTVKVRLQDSTGAVLEDSVDIASSQEYVDWARRSSQWADGVALLATIPKIASASPLATGADGGALATGDYTNAFSQLGKAYGPGQVCAPGQISSGILQSVVDHCAQYRRIGLLDGQDSASTATVLGGFTGLAGTNARYGAAFSPAVLFPGLTPNATRRIPASAIVAGRIADLDGGGGGYAQAAAGLPAGVIDGAVGLAQDYALETDQDALYNATTGAVNPILARRSGIMVYGWKTLANPASQADYIGLSTARVLMAFEWKADALAEQYVHQRITPAKINEFAQGLASIAHQMFIDGDLYGGPDNDENQAYYVNTKAPINTNGTAALRQINAEVGLKPTETADYVRITIVKTPFTEVFAA